MHVAPERHTWDQYKWLLFFLFPALKLESGLLSSADWAEVPGGKGLAYGLKIGDYCISGSSFPSKTKLLPSVYQISSGLFRGSSDNSSQGFVQWSKVSRQE